MKTFSTNSGDYTCQVKILNSASGIVIIKTLCTFTYDDGTTSSDPLSGEPGEVSIGHGEAGYRFSKDKCVTSVYCLVVTDKAGPFDATAIAPSGYCLVAPLFEIKPKSLVQKSALRDSGRYELSYIPEVSTPPTTPLLEDSVIKCNAIVTVKCGKVTVELDTTLGMQPGQTLPLASGEPIVKIVAGGGSFAQKNGHAIC